MTQLTYSVPTVGNPNSTEDPKLATALTQIQTVVNSELTADNMPTVLTGSLAQPTRATGTAYQPSTTRPTLVSVIATGVNGGSAQNLKILVGTTSSPTTEVSMFTPASGAVETFTATFLVAAGWYYEISGGVTNAEITTVTEWTL